MTEHDPASFEFVTDGPVWKGIPVVNGHKLMSVMSADIHLDGNSFPEVTLKLFASDLVKLGLGAAQVRMDEGTREALVSLGWTPPAEAGAREFNNRFTVIPDSGVTALNCFRCPGGNGDDTWEVGYHPSLDVLMEQARAHDAAKHGDDEAALPPGSECAP